MFLNEYSSFRFSFQNLFFYIWTVRFVFKVDIQQSLSKTGKSCNFHLFMFFVTRMCLDLFKGNIFMNTQSTQSNIQQTYSYILSSFQWFWTLCCFYAIQRNVVSILPLIAWLKIISFQSWNENCQRMIFGKFENRK